MINKMDNHLSPQTIEHKKKNPQHMTFEIQILEQKTTSHLNPLNIKKRPQYMALKIRVLKWNNHKNVIKCHLN